MRLIRACFLLGALTSAGCGGGESTRLDAAPPDRAPAADLAGDAAPMDAAPVDAAADATPDAGPRDAHPDGDAPDAEAGGVTVCTTWARPMSVGPVGDPALVEASGLVIGRRDPARLWLHNDSGDGPVLYTLSTADGAALGRWTLTGVVARDFEDIAAGPCPGTATPCLWVGDIGDNNRVRADAALIVVPEPDPQRPPGALDPSLVLPLTYPDGPVDAEALLVAPTGDAFWILEKGGDPQATRIFEGRGPFRSGEAVALRTVGSFAPLGLLVTGADLRPDGRQVLVRTYTGTAAYDLAAGQTPADLGAVPPRTAARGPLSEAQGEAVGYDHDALGFWTVSEQRGAGPVAVNFYPCEATTTLAEEAR